MIKKTNAEDGKHSMMLSHHTFEPICPWGHWMSARNVFSYSADAFSNTR